MTATLSPATTDLQILEVLRNLANQAGLSLAGGKIRRSSSRFCLGVEHGDYNGTELFGVGTDRFIWLAFKPNGTRRLRLFSGNFPEDGLLDISLDEIPEPGSPTRGPAFRRALHGF